MRYERLGQNLVIAECPQFYFSFVDELKNQGCIEYTPDERAAANKETNDSENAFDFDIDAARFDLTEKEIQDAISVIIQNDDVAGSIYVPGSRNDVILALGGYCYYRHITLKSAQDLIAKLQSCAKYIPQR